MYNDLFGPSIHLLVMDMFLEESEAMMNLREIARRVDKNPGSISRIMPRLVERGILVQERIGKVTHVYRLNKKSELVKLLIEFNDKLKKTGVKS